MNTIPVLSNAPKSYGIDSVAIPAAAQSFFSYPTTRATKYGLRLLLTIYQLRAAALQVRLD
jgi:hypothetical protein